MIPLGFVQVLESQRKSINQQRLMWQLFIYIPKPNEKMI